MVGGTAVLGLAGIAGAIGFAWLGLYNVAASRGHWYAIDLFLRFGMENSVEAHAPDIEPPPLNDPDLVRLGAGHYYAGCAYCHGAPGTPISPIAEDMLPPPPDLGGRVGLWTDQELFWIVKHGFKYTGMPAWPVQNRDDEIWAVIAFLRQLPGLDAAAYEDLALGGVEVELESGHAIATGAATSEAVDACARCHGSEGRPPASMLVPRLHGQPANMIAQALRDYASGKRPSGIMQTAASGLSERAIIRLANYYAGLTPLKPPPPAPARLDGIARGRELALRGDPENGVPACLSCHSTTAVQDYPRLASQSERYMRNRLDLWKQGIGAATGTNLIMAPIAQRLDAGQIEDVAAYFASLPMGGTAETAP